MQKLNEAYEVLRDPQKRQQYDAELQGIPHGFPGGMHGMQGFPGFPGFHGGGFPGGGMGGANLFDMLFHQMAGGINIEIMHNGNNTFIRRHVGKPETITKQVNVSLEQAYTGLIVQIDVERWTMRKEDGLRISENESINVQIPAGVDNGENILLEGVGNCIEEGNIKGDVKICVSVNKHATFVRNGADLHLKKTLTLKESLCGTQFHFEHLNGKNLTLNVTNAIIFPGGRKVFPNMGMPKKDGSVGNLVIEFDVQFPESLTPEQKQQLSNIL
jgi:DnaJ-class molecular chaperone